MASAPLVKRVLLVLLAATTTWPAALGDRAPRRYTVDLGIPAERRWDHVVAAEREGARNFLMELLEEPMIKPLVPWGRLFLTPEIHRLIPEEHHLELISVANGLGMQVSDLLFSAAFYDLVASNRSHGQACTGIVAQAASGEVFHGRNLDFAFKKELGELAVVVDFARDGATLFSAVTLGPNPVFNTAVRYGAFSLSHDERDSGSIVENILDMLVRGRKLTFSRIREAMETQETFEGAVQFFSEVELSAPSYFILGGVQAGEGAVITRERDRAVDVWRLDSGAGTWYVLETNYDRSGKVKPGDDRRAVLHRELDARGANGFNATSMWQVLSSRAANVTAGERNPLNELTIYSTVMQAGRPGTSGAFETLLRLGWEDADGNGGSLSPLPPAAVSTALVV